MVDLPPLSLVTTEHRVQKKVCSECGFETVAAFPTEAETTMQYGPRLKALGVYLLDFQLLPYQRIVGLFADLFDASFSFVNHSCLRDTPFHTSDFKARTC